MSQWCDQDATSGLSIGLMRPAIRLPSSPAMTSAEKFDADIAVDIEYSGAKRQRRGSCGKNVQRGFPFLRSVLFLGAVVGYVVLVNRPLNYDNWRALSGTSHFSSSSARSHKDYYSQPGMMVINHGNSESMSRARYIHLSSIDRLVNQTSSLVPDNVPLNDGWDDLMLLRNAVDEVDHIEDMKLPTELEHLRNKTILLLGDSVDRFFVDRFCNQMMADADARLSYRALHVAPHDLSDISDADKSPQGKEFNEFAEPHLCELPPELGGLKIWSLMHYGVLPQDEYEWAFKQQARSPRVATKKVELFAKKLVEHGYPAPDLVSVHSGLWDLATSNIRDVRASKPSAHFLDTATMRNTRQGNIGLLRTVADTWPQAKLMYRTLHTVRASPGAWFLAGLPLINGKPFPQIDRDPYAANKVAQINEGIRSVQTCEEFPHFDLFDLGRITQGYTADFLDDVHLQDSGLSLYAQMLMYQMRRYFGDGQSSYV